MKTAYHGKHVAPTFGEFSALRHEIAFHGDTDAILAQSVMAEMDAAGSPMTPVLAGLSFGGERTKRTFG